jgi:hypothetical protein
MRRREFIAGLGAAITGSIRTKAQQLPPVSLVGYLYAGPAEGFAFRQVAFRKGLAETDYRVPALYFERDYAEVGGLMSYGANVPEQYRQSIANSAFIPVAFLTAKSPATCL